MHLRLVISILSICPYSVHTDSNVEILPEDCDCRDWYGACRREGEKWIDDETWVYECNRRDGSDATFVGCATSTPTNVQIPVGANRTLGPLWHTCDANTLRLKYDSEPHCLVNREVKKVRSEFRDGRFQWLCLETGRWVVGCYYANETHTDAYIKIGEQGYNGLIKHVCDRYADYPGRVQYYAEVRKDVHVKHPTNKGINKNFPEPADLRIQDKGFECVVSYMLPRQQLECIGECVIINAKDSEWVAGCTKAHRCSSLMKKFFEEKYDTCQHLGDNGQPVITDDKANL